MNRIVVMLCGKLIFSFIYLDSMYCFVAELT